MAENANYWLFRSTGTTKRNPRFCLENNVVTYGWSDYDLKKNQDEGLKWIKKNYSAKAASMAKNFTSINKGDVVVLPDYGVSFISIGRVLKHEYRQEWRHADASNTYSVKWLVKYYPRNDLSSAFQRSLKYMGTFLNLWQYREELSRLIRGGFKKLEEDYGGKLDELNDESIERIAKHINNRQNLNFQDGEFEKFIMHILELQYPNLAGVQNSNKAEAKNVKSLTLSADYGILDIGITFNVQVEQHDGTSGGYALDRISKSDDNDPYFKKVLVTTGKLTDEIIEKEKEKGVVLIGPKRIAEMILENFDKIDYHYKAKLNLASEIVVLKD